MKTTDKIIGLKSWAIDIAPTSKTPGIKFEPNIGKLEIWGRSIPEHAIEFYRPLIESLRDYKLSPLPYTEVEMNLEYFNTSSSKCLLDILYILRDIKKKGGAVSVIWSYEEDDYAIKESGKDMEDIVGFKFIMKSLQAA